MSLLEVSDLSVEFRPSGRSDIIHAVDGVSLTIAAGETVGLVGGSGCGKTTLARAAARLLSPTSGRVVFDGEDITTMTEHELRPRRKNIQLVFQDRYGSLNPWMTVGEAISEALSAHGWRKTGAVQQEKITELLVAVGLDWSHAKRLPDELSGGQRQRVGIARALAVNPKLILFDEGVSALDVSVQAQILNLIQDLQRERSIAFLFIAHDLAVVAHVSRTVLVMFNGRIVESGPARLVLTDPLHPYTSELVAASILVETPQPQSVRAGNPAGDAENAKQGCAYYANCPRATDRCRMEAPQLRSVSKERQVSCHIA